jgi:hypothetical protein
VSDTRPALEYLLACSNVSLESFHISRMNQATKLRKQVRALVDEWVDAEVDAGLSRWMLRYRRTDAIPAILESAYASASKSHQRVTISFRQEHAEVHGSATRQLSFATGLIEVKDSRACPLLGDGTMVSDECKNMRQRHAKRLRRPYARPLARRYQTNSLGDAGAIATPVTASPKAQHDSEFERERPFVSSGAEGRPEATPSHATSGVSCSPT